MKTEKEAAQTLLAEKVYAVRKSLDLSQERMAEQLHISARAYGNLERDESSQSAPTLLSMMAMMEPEERAALLSEFREAMGDVAAAAELSE